MPAPLAADKTGVSNPTSNPTGADTQGEEGRVHLPTAISLTGIAAPICAQAGAAVTVTFRVTLLVLGRTALQRSEMSAEALSWRTARNALKQVRSVAGEGRVCESTTVSQPAVSPIVEFGLWADVQTANYSGPGLAFNLDGSAGLTAKQCTCLAPNAGGLFLPKERALDNAVN